MKALVLARVSTPEQEEAGNSLPAQIARIRKYCEANGLKVAKTYSFDESAYKTQRSEFDRALEYIDSTNEKVAVCFDKVDRFSRNVFDKRVSELYELAMKDKIELHFVSDNLVINSDISATQKFHFGMNLGLAKYYSDAISDNVKRSYEQKIRRGEWIGKAPIGYINTQDDNDDKTIEQDPQRAHLINKIFEMYASGKYSMGMIRNEAQKMGLTNNTPTAKPISKSQVEHILKNPFYYGEMRIKGSLYPHRYKPLITRYLFDRTQNIAKNWHKKPFKYGAMPFVFRGLIKCECGCTISPELKKKKYRLYACSNYKKAHEKREYISEEKLLKPIFELLESLRIPDDKLEMLTGKLKDIHEVKNQYHNKEMDRLRKGYDAIEARLSKMYDDKLDGSITTDMYDSKLREYKSKQSDILLQMEEHSQGDENFYVTANAVLDLAKRATEIFEEAEIQEQRELLSFLLSNPVLKGKELAFTARKPFDAIAEANASEDWLRGSDSNRHVLNTPCYNGTMQKNCRKHGKTKHFPRKDGSFRCNKCASEWVINSRRKKKEKLVELFGGKCKLCGYDRYAGALDFHHKDAKTKSFALSVRGLAYSWDSVLEETKKCVLLCKTCHAEVENNIRSL